MRALFSLRRFFRPKSSPRIFAYYDGSNWRTIDPLAVIYGLTNHAEYVDARHFKGACQGDQESVEIASKTVCDVFGVNPYDPKTQTGLTIGERIGLLRTFAVYVDSLKKNIESSSTAPQSTDAT